jgi:hypothetical protein
MFRCTVTLKVRPEGTQRLYRPTSVVSAGKLPQEIIRPRRRQLTTRQGKQFFAPPMVQESLAKEMILKFNRSGN